MALDCFPSPCVPKSKQRKGACSSHLSKCFNKRLLNKHITHLKFEKKFYSCDESNSICILTVVGERHLVGAARAARFLPWTASPTRQDFSRERRRNIFNIWRGGRGGWLGGRRLRRGNVSTVNAGQAGQALEESKNLSHKSHPGPQGGPQGCPQPCPLPLP